MPVALPAVSAPASPLRDQPAGNPLVHVGRYGVAALDRECSAKALGIALVVAGDRLTQVPP
jgi:hypothetical protein